MNFKKEKRHDIPKKKKREEEEEENNLPIGIWRVDEEKRDLRWQEESLSWNHNCR